MGWRLTYTKPATRDLEELVRCIAHERPDAADKLGLPLVELAESLATFPYVVLYRLDEPHRVVRILRFWHGRRDPRSWSC